MTGVKDITELACGGAATHPRLAELTVATASTFAWYALPDYVRSGLARGVLKGALGAGLIAWLAPRPGVHAALEAAAPAALARRIPGSASEGAKTFLAVGAIGAVFYATARAESALFYRAERRRESGARLPHTRQALVLSGLVGAATLLEREPRAGAASAARSAAGH